MIDPNEHQLAAKFFAIRNMAFEHMLGRGIEGAFRQAQNDLAAADLPAEGMIEEKNEWLESIQSGCAYCEKEWNLVREKYVQA